jgi:hypothetical protein
MQKINTESNLDESILQLENRQAEERELLRAQFLLTYEQIKPLNLIKNTLRDMVDSPEIKDNVLNTSVGLAAGYVSKSLFERVSNNPFKRVIGAVLLLGITKAVERNPDLVKSFGRTILGIFRGRKNVPAMEIEQDEHTQEPE